MPKHTYKATMDAGGNTQGCVGHVHVAYIHLHLHVHIHTYIRAMDAGGNTQRHVHGTCACCIHTHVCIRLCILKRTYTHKIHAYARNTHTHAPFALAPTQKGTSMGLSSQVDMTPFDTHTYVHVYLNMYIPAIYIYRRHRRWRQQTKAPPWDWAREWT